MPRVETWSCRVCGKFKNGINNWWLVGRLNEQFLIRPMGDGCRILAEEDAVCGRECLQKEVEKYLGEMAKGGA